MGTDLDAKSGIVSVAPKPSVLVVDDDRPLAHSIQRHLVRLGCRVELAHDGQGAIEQLAHDSFDLILLDLCMQPRDGWYVMSALRNTPHRPRIIVVSGAVDVATAVQAMRHGAEDVLQKPLALDTLVHEVLRIARTAMQPTECSGARDAADRLLGDAPEIGAMREKLRSVARYRDMPVLIVGETGTGKELVAQAIHELSGSSAPLVALNCAAIPEQLFESEIFGHEVGAFTGSRGARRGLIEEAGDGTLFLDEVGEMSPAVQAKLLRALETRRFRRVGANTDLPFGARIVSATHRTVQGVADGTLRADLYYRLAAFTIHLPPLRERPGDIEKLAVHFLEGFARRYGQPAKRLSPGALEMLRGHKWPGNVRELRSAIDRAAVTSSTDMIEEHVILGAIPALERGSVAALDAARQLQRGPSISGVRAAPAGIRELERHLILEAFDRSAQNLSVAARELGIPRSTLRDKLRRFDVR